VLGGEKRFITRGEDCLGDAAKKEAEERKGGSAEREGGGRESGRNVQKISRGPEGGEPRPGRAGSPQRRSPKQGRKKIPRNLYRRCVTGGGNLKKKKKKQKEKGTPRSRGLRRERRGNKPDFYSQVCGAKKFRGTAQTLLGERNEKREGRRGKRGVAVPCGLQGKNRPKRW